VPEIAEREPIATSVVCVNRLFHLWLKLLAYASPHLFYGAANGSWGGDLRVL
jgi:hypothetical protein